MNQCNKNYHKPKGHDNPLAEGKYHYRYDDPYDTDHISCIDCYAPYSHHWTNRDKVKLAYLPVKNHYSCTFDKKIRYKNDHGIETTKFISKKFVCFSCRHIIKRPISLSWNYSYNQFVCSGPWNTKKEIKKNTTFKWPNCYKCNHPMTCVNSKFEVPNKNNDKSWNYMKSHWNNNSKMTYSEFNKFVNQK